MYLLAAVRDNLATFGPRPFPARVWGTELEAEKAARALEHIREAFSDNDEIQEIEAKSHLNIMVGDLLQTIKAEAFEDNSIDALLLDSKLTPGLWWWIKLTSCCSSIKFGLSVSGRFPIHPASCWRDDFTPTVALPTLELLSPSLRPGAVLFVDNAITSAPRYAKLNAFLRDPKNGWHSILLPFTNGFEMAVKTRIWEATKLSMPSTAKMEAAEQCSSMYNKSMKYVCVCRISKKWKIINRGNAVNKHHT
jgi:hypothetical protein